MRSIVSLLLHWRPLLVLWLPPISVHLLSLLVVILSLSLRGVLSLRRWSVVVVLALIVILVVVDGFGIT